MLKPFTSFIRLMLLALALGTGFTSQGQIIPQPVAITAASFTADIVANGNSQTVNGSTFGAADAVSNFFPAVDFTTTATPNFFHPTIGLPAGRSFLSIGTPNVLFNLQTYGTTPPSAGNYNSLRLYGATTGTLTFATPQTASTIYVLATCGSGPDVGTFTVNFSDGTTQSFGRTIPDWFSGTLANGTTAAYYINARVSAGSTNFDNQVAGSNPRLYQIVLPLTVANMAKTITGVTYIKTTSATQTVQLMGVSAAPASTYTPVPLVFPATGTAVAPVSNAFASPTAYGQDVIANGTGQTTAAGSASSASADTDGGGYYLMSTDYNSTASTHPTIGLPFAGINSVTTTGLIPSLATPGLTFQLANYSGINALQVRGATNGTVDLATPTAGSEAYVLIEPVLLGVITTAAGTITIIFSDGTTHAFPVTYTNWYNTTPSSPASIAYNMLGRLNGGTSNTVNTSGSNAPYLQEYKLVLSSGEVSKTISSVRVASASAATIVSVLGVSLNTSASCSAAIASGLTAASSTATACASTIINLTLNGVPAQAGYAYQWEYNANNTGWAAIPTTNATGPLSANATSATCVVTNQQVATQYRCQVTCAAGGGASPSAAAAVDQTDFINCYCYPALPTTNSSCGTYGTITGVAINNGSGLSQTGLTCPSNPYTSYGVVLPSTATGTLDKASSTGYTLSVTVSNASRMAAWLDINHSGTYEASEALTITATSTGAGTLTAAIPASLLTSALTGLTGLRIRTERNTGTILNSATNSCATTPYGETLDYTVKIANVAPCAGTPTATVPTQFPAGAMCAGTTFTLTATGPEIDAGTTNLTYLWEYKLSSASTWAAVPATLTATDGTVVTTNSTTGIATIANQREATDYRVTITCASAGGSSGTSPVLTVAQTPFVNCYCQPTAASVADYITNVTLQDINNTSGNSTTTPLLGYADYTASPTTTQTTTLNAGATYAISVAGQSSSTTSSQMVWIDYDHSGTFDTNEYTPIGSGTPSGALTRTNTITLPTTALLGNTHMRVRWHNTASANTGACDTGWGGETEEYLVTIAAEVPCSTPTPLTASSSATAPCSGTSFTLTATGAAAAGQSGLTYQWEKSAAGANSFSPISGATGLTLTTSLTASTDYHIVTTCATGGATAASNTVSVTLGYLNCYCTPSSTPSNEYVSEVTMTGSTPFTNLTGGTGTTSQGYNNYTGNSALTTTLNQGGIYPITVSIRANASPSQAALWIDFDHSGTFDANANEYYLLGTPANSGNYSYPINVTVPANAPLGPTRMRVRERNSLFANTAGCDASGYGGETEDYLITVGPPLPCTNPPATITATADVTNACANTAFTLSTSSIPPGTTGFTFQWQSRETGSGNAFVDITSATTFSYALTGQAVPTDYQLIVSCAGGGVPVASNTVAVGQNTYDQCYCSVVHGSGCSTYGSITNVSINGMTSGTGCAGGANYTVVPANTATTTLTTGASYTLSTTFASSPSISAGMWVDYNHNGTFDSSEFSGISASTGSGTLNTALTVPTTALAGTTRMRIRTESTGVSQVTAGRACDTFVYGETEDYTLSIVAPLPVKLISFTAAAQANAVRLDWATASELHSERFEVERSTDGKTFELIGTVAAQGNSTHRIDYEFLDTKALAKATTRYYRLRQVDVDGTAEYSPVRSVQLGSLSHLELYPNPAHRDLSVTGATAGAAVEIFDALGRTVLTAPANADGQARLTLPASLPSGVYIVRSGTEVRRLTVE